MRSRAVLAITVAVTLAAVLAAVLVRGLVGDDTGPPASDAEPLQSFDSVSSGVALMEALDCAGKPLVVSDGVTEHRVRGTGFLVGSRVLMGVEHMIPRTRGVVCGFVLVWEFAGSTLGRSASGANAVRMTGGASISRL